MATKIIKMNNYSELTLICYHWNFTPSASLSLLSLRFYIQGITKPAILQFYIQGITKPTIYYILFAMKFAKGGKKFTFS